MTEHMLPGVFAVVGFYFDIVWLYSFRFLFKGPEMLQKRYVTGRPYRIQTPQGLYLVTSSQQHLKELRRAPTDHLSLVTFFSDMFHMKHTMHSIQLSHAPSHHRVLQKFTQSVTIVREKFEEIIERVVSCHPTGLIDNKKGYKPMSAYTLAEEIIGNLNFYFFLGDSNGQVAPFLKAAHYWLYDLFIASEALHYTPAVLAPVVTWIITRGHRSLMRLRAFLIPIVEEGIKATKWEGKSVKPYYANLLTEHYREHDEQTVSDIVQQFLAIWLASTHLPTITLTYALYDLCLHPEYVQPLRQEINKNLDETGPILNKLELLDSFLKESARMNAAESISLRRKALKDFTFSDGLGLKSGEVVCAPLQAMGRDPLLFHDPDIFDGKRFLGAEGRRASKLTDISDRLPIWGGGKEACPGRFYAAVVLKATLAYIIRSYDIRLVDPDAVRTFSWRTTIVPRRSTEIVLLPIQNHRN